MNDPGLQTLDYAAVVAYLAVTWWIAYRATRKTDDTEDFFLGGRSMPWFAVGLSIMATLLSTNTYLGVPGEMIKHGPAYFLGYAAYPFVYVIVAWLWIPFFMRLRMTSAYEYLERRFDFKARILGNILFLGLRLGWMSMVVYTASLAMAAMVPGPLQRVANMFYQGLNPIYVVIIAVGIAATIYACVGGIKAVIWTDVLQSVMLFGGVGAIIGYTMWLEGNGPTAWWDAVVAEGNATAAAVATASDSATVVAEGASSTAKTSVAPAPAGPKVLWFGSFDIAERTTIFWAFLSVLAWHSCTHCCDQVALQRYFTTTSAKAASRSFVVSLVSSALIGILLAVSGLALRYYYLQHDELLPAGLTPHNGADKLMPLFFAQVLPAGFGGLILVSFLCDALQTLGSGVNSIAAIITRDAQQHGVEEADGIRAARITTLGIGALTTVLAVLASYYASKSGSTIIDMMPRMFNMFLGPLAVMFMIGMFYRRATAGIAITVVLLTQLISVIYSWWSEVPTLLTQIGMTGAAEAWIGILGRDASGAMRVPTVMLAIFVPAVFGLITGAVASLLFGRSNHPGTDYTWPKVLQRPTERAETV